MEKCKAVLGVFRNGPEAGVKPALLDLMEAIESECPEAELHPAIQDALMVLVSIVESRSWTEDNRAFGLFVLGKSAGRRGGVDIINLSKNVMDKIGSKSEARQLLISIENQILSEQGFDLVDASLVARSLQKGDGIWEDDPDLKARVLDGLSGEAG